MRLEELFDKARVGVTIWPKIGEFCVKFVKFVLLQRCGGVVVMLSGAISICVVGFRLF